MLEGKQAAVFGAGGSIGRAVATELAGQGARVLLSGQNVATVAGVADKITAAGGSAEAAKLDAGDDEAAVETYLRSVVNEAGRLDVAFNATGPRAGQYGNGKLAVDLPVDDFMVPLTSLVRSQFITARAAGRHMARQHSGVLLFLTGSPAKPHTPGATAIGAAFAAIENLAIHLALELGGSGVRAICLRSTGMPDTRTMHETFGTRHGGDVVEEEIAKTFAERAMLGAAPHTADTARVLAFLASERARMMTGTVINASAGAIPD
jgi:NAD(P)-dependent dehydrogenase (short-subunit alcohol dehydrogenase family)